MKALHFAVLLCGFSLSACQHGAALAEHKPTAPVKLSLETRALGNGDYELTLTATTTAALDALVLKTGDATKEFTALESGATRTINARVHVSAGEGLEVTGTARTVKGPRQMSAVTAIWLGVKPPEKPSNIIPLPDGEQAEEVRE
jgi:hypothetical protein